MVRVTQQVNKACYDPDTKDIRGDQGGRSEYNCSNAYDTLQRDDFYVADLGEFTLHLTHSFDSRGTGLHGISRDFLGFLAACPSNHPVDVATECKRMKVPNTHGECAPEDELDLIEPISVGVSSLTGSRDGIDVVNVMDLLRV